jgi:hypothetical protein
MLIYTTFFEPTNFSNWKRDFNGPILGICFSMLHFDTQVIVPVDNLPEEMAQYPSNSELSSNNVKLMPSHHPARTI